MPWPDQSESPPRWLLDSWVSLRTAWRYGLNAVAHNAAVSRRVREREC